MSRAVSVLNIFENHCCHDSKKYPKKVHDEKISEKIGPHSKNNHPGYAPGNK